jgi:16S rRNA (cytosine967-C5)-methyltransferase
MSGGLRASAINTAPPPGGGGGVGGGSSPGQSAPLSKLLAHTADAVQAVRSGQSLSAVLPKMPADVRPAVQSLSFHVLRWLGSATEARAHLAPKNPPPEVDALLVTALALLWPGEPLPYAEHTLVDQAVTAARQRVPVAAAFINAVLRRFLREQAAVVAAVRHGAVGAYNHPLWWVERIKRDWPTRWQSLLLAANQRPPMTLRVNARRCTGESYVQRLAAVGRVAHVLPQAEGGSPQTVVLAQALPVQQLLGFAEGEVSVQDAAAQRAALLLLAGLKPASRVLDACAAPGGKTAHLLEAAGPGQIASLLALDSDPVRLQRVQETLTRLQLRDTASHVQVGVGDARQPRTWWDGQPFDAILLDAPCTASGIVRRHPDVRWLRRAEDVGNLARVQAELLAALWPLLAPGGRMLYATCSVFKAEGQQQIDAFLRQLPAGAARLDPASPGHLLTSPDNVTDAAGASGTGHPAPPPALQDGFFYALIHKT